jgi:hypothetical protein
MTLAETLDAAMAADLELISLVSSRIYRNRLPKTAIFPAIVFSRISSIKDYVHCGPGSIEPSWQFTCWATSSKVADQVTNVLERVLEGYNMFVEGRTDGMEPDTDLYYVRLAISNLVQKE